MTDRAPLAMRAIALLACLMVLGCGGDAAGSEDPAGPVVVTFEVVDERFKALEQ